MADLVDLADRVQKAGVLSDLSQPLQTALFLGALTLIPAALISLTSFTRIVIVLSFVRRAVTSQDLPPNIVLNGLALFLTYFTMAPTFEEIGERCVTPYLDKKVTGTQAVRTGTEVMSKFMLRHTRKQDLALFLHLSGSASP